MSNVQIGYTEIGPMLGDWHANATSKGIVYDVENPVLLQQMGQQLGFVPILGFTKSKRLQIAKNDLLYEGELFDPQDELRNHWNSQFGSGIVLSTAATPAEVARKK